MDKTIVTKLKEELDSTFELLKRYKDYSDKASDIISRLEKELDNSLEALSKYKRVADEQSQKIVSLEKEVKRLENIIYELTMQSEIGINKSNDIRYNIYDVKDVLTKICYDNNKNEEKK